jgi:hypothetical protein
VQHLFSRILKVMREHLAPKTSVSEASPAFRQEIVAGQAAAFIPPQQPRVERGPIAPEGVRPDEQNPLVPQELALPQPLFEFQERLNVMMRNCNIAIERARNELNNARINIRNAKIELPILGQFLTSKNFLMGILQTHVLANLEAEGAQIALAAAPEESQEAIAAAQQAQAIKAGLTASEENVNLRIEHRAKAALAFADQRIAEATCMATQQQTRAAQARRMAAQQQARLAAAARLVAEQRLALHTHLSQFNSKGLKQLIKN